METWVAGGQDPDTFWHTTLRKQKVVLRGVEKSIERQTDIARFGAYQTALLMRLAINDPNNFPSFEEFWGQKGVKRRQSPDEMRALMIAWAASSGGEVNL